MKRKKHGLTLGEYRKAFRKESREHPWATPYQVRRIVLDHLK